MHNELYTTLAQVLPVLLLALMWDSAYLTRLQAQRRPSRRHDPDSGFRWTKPRVRAYILTVASVLLADIFLAVLVLAGTVDDTNTVRALTVCGVVVALGSLLFRVWFDVMEATRDDPPDPDGGAPGPPSA